MITGSLVNRYSLLRDAAWDYYQSLPVQAALATMLFDTICHPQLPLIEVRFKIGEGGGGTYLSYVGLCMYSHYLEKKYSSSVGTKAHIVILIRISSRGIVSEVPAPYWETVFYFYFYFFLSLFLSFLPVAIAIYVFILFYFIVLFSFGFER